MANMNGGTFLEDRGSDYRPAITCALLASIYNWLANTSMERRKIFSVYRKMLCMFNKSLTVIKEKLSIYVKHFLPAGK